MGGGKQTHTDAVGGKNTEDRKKDRRSWTEMEKEESLDYLLNTIQSGFTIEKPNAHAYYETAAKKLHFAECNGGQLRNAVSNMKRKYIKAKDWRNKTGEGLLIEEGEESVLAKVRKMCPFFDKLDEIFGIRSNISPPVVHDSADASRESQNVPSDEVPNLQIDANECQANSLFSTLQNDMKPNGGTRKRKAPNESGIEVLASAAKLRFDVKKEELELKKDQLAQQKEIKESEEKFQREKFEFEKMVAERNLAMEEKKIQNNFELEKYKIDQNLKLQLELAKLGGR